MANDVPRGYCVPTSFDHSLCMPGPIFFDSEDGVLRNRFGMIVDRDDALEVCKRIMDTYWDMTPGQITQENDLAVPNMVSREYGLARRCESQDDPPRQQEHGYVYIVKASNRMIAQLSFDTTPAPAVTNNRAEPAPAAVPVWDNDDTCDRCGAEAGISGAHDHDGAWWHTPAIVTRYGWTFPDRPTWGDTFAEPVTQTRLVGGICQWCRKGGA